MPIQCSVLPLPNAAKRSSWKTAKWALVEIIALKEVAGSAGADASLTSSSRPAQLKTKHVEDASSFSSILIC
ncbi:hypothetical protein CPC08DRAFT_769446 [Agrocybe pediades]|nr:hypothetical protein CPC08DRAFT_769446 [Agrocybe pediades]